MIDSSNMLNNLFLFQFDINSFFVIICRATDDKSLRLVRAYILFKLLKCIILCNLKYHINTNLLFIWLKICFQLSILVPISQIDLNSNCSNLRNKHFINVNLLLSVIWRKEKYFIRTNLLHIFTSLDVSFQVSTKSMFSQIYIYLFFLWSKRNKLSLTNFLIFMLNRIFYTRNFYTFILLLYP